MWSGRAGEAREPAVALRPRRGRARLRPCYAYPRPGWARRRGRYALPRWGGACCRRRHAARQRRGGARAGEAWDLKYGGRGCAVAMGGGE